MRISLHAGLHKSGTTSIQAAFFAAFSNPTAIWYPDLGDPYHTHNGLAREFTAASWAAQPDTGHVDIAKYLQTTKVPLSKIIAEAEARGVEHLLISAEAFDEVTPTQCTRLADVLAGYDVTVLLTVTRPSHRWYSLWQELVKHGLALRPFDARPHLVIQCALLPTRLGELINTLPGTRKVVRIVRTDPLDLELPRSVGALLGIELPTDDVLLPPANISIGPSVELLRALNERNLTHGVMTPDSIARFVEYREAHPAVPGTLQHADRYGTPPDLGTTAAAELAFLRAAATEGTIELFDPDDELARWTDMTPPGWMAEALLLEWPLSSDRTVTDVDQAWEARIDLATWIREKNTQISELEATCGGLREELVATREELVASEERTAAELADVHSQNRELHADTTSLNEAIRSMQESRSWRLLSPLRRLRQR